MKDGRLLLYLLLNVFVSACVTGGILFFYDRQQRATMPPSTAGTRENTPVAAPATLAPGVRVEIATVVGAGLLENERVMLRNTGDTSVALNGWRLQDDAGNIFYFPESNLHAGGTLTIHSAPGTNSVIALYWGLSRPVWQSGKLISLLDASGAVQAQYQIP
jgi:hypothetical protein